MSHGASCPHATFFLLPLGAAHDPVERPPWPPSTSPKAPHHQGGIRCPPSLAPRSGYTRQQHGQVCFCCLPLSPLPVAHASRGSLAWLRAAEWLHPQAVRLGSLPQTCIAISGPRCPSPSPVPGPRGFLMANTPGCPSPPPSPGSKDYGTPDCLSLPPWAVGLPSGRFGCVVSGPRWVPTFPVALARFFAVGCVAYIALRAAVGSPGLAPRSGHTRMQLGQVRPPWPLGRGDRGLLAPLPP